LPGKPIANGKGNWNMLLNRKPMAYMLNLLREGFIDFRFRIWSVLFSAFLGLPAASPAHPANVSPHVEYLCIPLAARYPGGADIYARNVWDLQAFKGRIYVGGGNWDNKGPAPNAGPVPILAWDPDREEVVREGEVDDEEISRFEVIAGNLYIPGADAMESWKLGNLYRREADGRWHKLRTIPRSIHALALTGYDDRLFVGLKATDTVPWYVDFEGYGSAVAVSSDGGGSWKFLPLGGYVISEFLQVAGRLYAVDLTLGPGLRQWISKQDREDHHAPVYALDPLKMRFARRPDLDAAHLFPDTAEALVRACGVHRPVSFSSSALYIGASGGGPFGLYRADSLRRGAVRTARMPLPEGTIPRDLLVRDGAVFVLLQGPADRAGVQIRVLASRDLKKWIELLNFPAPTFARSFEILNRDFYFGLGCEVKKRSEWDQAELHPETGRLLRVRGKYLPALSTILK